jgi:MinD-like ATPase involved in chromosome partitioning or flagellar assembly
MYYTWGDIECGLKLERNKWPSCWDYIEVYPDELIIHSKDGFSSEEIDDKTSEYLSSFLGNGWNNTTRTITLQITNKQMQVVLESMEDDSIPLKNFVPQPLFKNVFFHSSGIEIPELNVFPVPVIAFHSYKGGVGRTLSLFSLVRELTQHEGYKTLIIDADLEAPGLTIMAKEFNFPSSKRISYSDILSIIHDSTTEALFGDILCNIADAIGNSTITIPAKDILKEQYFLPAYRFEYQLLDNFVHPENIISMPGRNFIITEFLSKLGEKLKVDAVLIDLRAGLSELSAPVLFDPRVRRVFVTSTSKQSIDGTKKFILKKILSESPFSGKSLIKNSAKYQEIVSPTILLTMVPHTFDEEKLKNLKSELIQSIPADLYGVEEGSEIDDEVLSDIVIHSEFNEQLIHLEDLSQINRMLINSDTANASKELFNRLIPAKRLQENDKVNFTETERKKIIEKINNLVSKELTAEANDGVNMMTTEALENLAKDYRDVIPQLVIPGAKGSGKTYIYKQLLKSVNWGNFIKTILFSEQPAADPLLSETMLIMPVLATINRRKIRELFDGCFRAVEKALGITISVDILEKNENILKRYKDDTTLKETDWLNIWNNFFLDSLSSNNTYKDLSQLDSELSSKGKKIIFIIDGIEDIFNETITIRSSKNAIRTLCQDFVNNISNYKNIGILIFIRTDMIQSSINNNRDQFNEQYSEYTLKWSQDEAQRLIIWILSQVGFKNYGRQKAKIPKLNHEAISGYLVPFWGLKLGKENSNEAFSSRWILAALSDLNNHLQARDIIRFLKYATLSISKDIYNDRILMPNDIRKAIKPCSINKREEIIEEIKDLAPIFKKLESVAETEKILPIRSDTILSSDELKQLEIQGYLKYVDGVYYFPEIIRHALGYKYLRGSRPKVLSLLLK